MSIASTDPGFLLIYGLDESGPNSTRANSGSLGSAQALTVAQSAGTDGIPTTSDGISGKAIDNFVSRTGYTSALRRLRAAAALGNVHTCRPALPINSASDDWAFGCRFRWDALYTAGGAPQELIFGMVDESGGVTGGWQLRIQANSSTAPTLATLYLAINSSKTAHNINSGTYTITGSPPTNFINPGYWYRVLVRVYNNGTNKWKIKIYVLEESTGTIYTFTHTADLTSSQDYNATDNAASMRVQIGSNVGSLFSNFGLTDECWLFDSPMSDTDATTLLSGGISIPWTAPNYSQLDHVVSVSVAKEGASFPPPRALPTGGLKARHPLNVRGARLKVKYSSVRPGRPWALRDSQMIFDSSGPRAGRTNEPMGLIKFDGGFMRRPGSMPPNVLVDGRNVELTTGVPRSRRGFRIRRDVATVDARNTFMSYRDLSDNLFQLYKVGDAIYYESGSAATSISTGWGSNLLPSYALLNGRIVVLTSQKQRTHRSSSSAMESFGIAAPAAPTTALTAGTLTGTYYYLYTEYDPNTGDESAPGVAAASVSPAAQGVTLTLAAVSSDTRFSKRRIYRSASGGAAITGTLIATINTATSYTDSGAADGVTTIGQVLGSYITGTPPDTFAAVRIHRERAFYYQGTTYPNRLYWTEAGTLMRWYANSYIEAEGPIRLILSWGQRILMFTDHTVEIVESDWIRDSSTGACNIQRTVVSRTVGAFGHRAGVNAHGQIFFVGPRGAYTMDGDTPIAISEPIKGLFPYINTNLKAAIIVAYNHIRDQIWFCLPIGASEFQSDSGRIQTILPFNLKNRTWSTPYRLDCCFADQFDDDLNGIQFGIMDRLGLFKQMETYEGDGIDGSETFTFEGTLGSAISSRVCTPAVAPTGWTTNSLRGMGVLLVDSVTKATFYSLIESNTSTTFTTLEAPGASFGSGDSYYVGGFESYIEPAEQDFGTKNAKVVRFLHSEFDDISTARVV